MAGVGSAGSVAGGAPVVPPDKPDGRLVRAAQDFASMLWEEVLHSALPSDTLMGDASPGADVYGGLVQSGLADVMGRGSGGLATLLLESLAGKGGGSTPHGVSGPKDR